MNCRDFETIVIELAGGDRLDPAEQAVGLAHAEGCSQCAARLADQRSLAAALAALAADDLDKIAPPNVEAALLESFWRKAKAPSAVPRPVRAWEPSPWAIAAAALVLVALGLLISIAWQDDLIKGPPRVDHPPSPASSMPAPLMAEDGPRAVPGINAAPERGERSMASRPQSGAARSSGPSRRGLPALEAGPWRGTAAPPRPHRPDRAPEVAGRVIVVRDDMTVYGGESDNSREITTDFLLLSSVSRSAPMERGQLVRVRMPRSALVSFGLPMNAERAEIPIKADLLVGEDGVARAIRFVR